MDTAEIRKNIHQYVDIADYRLLHILNAIISEDKNRIVAYSIEGKPLTLKDYQKELDNSEIEFENGEFTSQEDLEKEIKSW